MICYQRSGTKPQQDQNLPLAWLAPNIGSAILEVRQPAVLTSTRLRALPDLPPGWSDQRGLLGFPAI